MTFVDFIRKNASWILAGGVLTFMSSFGQTFFISIFGGEIRDDFGLSHAEWGSIYAIGTGVSAIVMVWAGVVTDILRTRVLGAIVLIGLAVACVAMASISHAFLLPFVIFALRFFGQGMCSHLAVVAMSRWFVSNRGRALSLAGLGFSIGEAFLPMCFVFVMGFWHWQNLWLVAAGVCLLAIPVLLRLLRNERTPQSLAATDQSLGMEGRHWRRLDAIKHPLFWVMVPSILGTSAFGTAFFFHQVHYADLKDWEHFTMVAFFPLFTGATVLMMLVAGWALDRFGTASLVPYFQVPLVLAFLCFAFANDLSLLALGLVLFSVTAGANATLPNAFWAEFYGTQHLGAIKALAAAVMVLGSAIGPGVTGYFIDTGVGLETQFIWVSGYFVLCTLALIVGVRRYAPLIARRSGSESARSP